MADKGNLVLHYRGGETDTGEIGYYTAASAMMAFGDLMGIMSRTSYGDLAKVETRVSNISPTGSISFEFVVIAVAIGQSVLAPVGIGQMWELLKQCVEAFKFLKGSPPKALEKGADGNFMVTNVNGMVRVFNQNTILIIGDSKAGKAIEQLVKKPMEQAGLTEILLEDKVGNDQITIKEVEGKYFTDLSRAKTVFESTAERLLYIESVKFRDGNKWDFFDGQSRFSAAILDEDFIARVNNGEPFAKDDILVVDLHSIQSIESGKLHTDHEILRVKTHQNKAEQLRLGM